MSVFTIPYRVVTNFAVALVEVDRWGVIVEAAPIFRRWVGRGIDDLRAWGPVTECEPLLKEDQ